MQRPPAAPTMRAKSPAWPLLIVGLGTLVVPLDSAVNIDFSAIVARFEPGGLSELWQRLAPYLQRRAHAA